MQAELMSLCLNVAVLAGGAAPATGAADKELTQATGFADEEGRYDQAERLLLQILDQGSQAPAAAELAAMYERLGEIEAAAEMYQRAVAAGGVGQSEQKRLEFRLDLCRRQRMSLVRFPVSVEAETETRQFEGLLSARQWAPAFTILGRIIEKFNGTFLQRGSGQYLGVWQWARSLLDGLPEEGRAAYRDWVSKAWAGALADGSVEAYRGFVDGQPGSNVDGPALLAWADTLADEGRTALALGLLARPEIEPAAAAQWRGRWEAHNPSTTPAGGLPDSHSWPGGLGSGWTVPLGEAATPGDIGVAAAEGKVFVYHRFKLAAYDAAGGGSLWQYRATEPAERRDVRRELYGRSRMPRSKWTGAVDPPAILVCPAGVLIVENYTTTDDDEDHHVVSVVTCLDQQTGTVRWRLAKDPLFDRLRVCSEPVYAGGKVFVTAASRGEYPEFWLCALDGQDGRVIWRKAIATSATPTRCIGRGLLQAGWSGPTLVVDGQIVYYATQMGAVVAVDRDLGQPLWALSYPRVPRCGPLSRATIPLLERRTEPLQITPKHLVLLPRDVNGLLVIDRATGKLERTIRSLDLVGLVTADDERALVTTLAGEARVYSIKDGKLAWSWSAPAGESMTRPAVSGRQVIVPHGGAITRLDLATGALAGETSASRDTGIRQALPAGLWVAVSPGCLRVLSDQTAKAAVQPGAADLSAPRPSIACARPAKQSGGWRYDAYVASPEAEAKMVLEGQDGRLIVADASGLAAYSPYKGYERCWRRPFDAGRGTWAVPTPAEPAGPAAEKGPSLLAYSEDRETVRLIDAMTGTDVAAGRVEETVPVRSLHVAGQDLLVAGTSSVAMVHVTGESATPGGPTTGPSTTRARGLAVRWKQDFSPRTFAAVFANRQLVTLLVQPGGAEPGRLLCLDAATGKIIHSFVIVAPVSPEPADGEHHEDRRERGRSRIGALQYTQSALTVAGAGYEVTVDGQNRVALSASPIRLLDQSEGCLFIEIAQYWGMVEKATGRVTLLAPDRRRDSSAGRTQEEQVLQEWVRSHPGHGRDEDPQFVFEGKGLRFARGDQEAESEEARRDRLVGGSGGLLMLDGLRPKRVDRAGPWLVLNGEGGIAVVCEGDPGKGTVGAQGAGKVPGDLFDPPGVGPVAARGLALDGDLADWPAGGWQVMVPARYAWPPSVGPGGSAGGSAAFQWAMDASAVWLAVRVEGGTTLANSGAPAVVADGVEVLLTGYVGHAPQASHQRASGERVVFSLSSADSMPVGRIRVGGRAFLLARPAGTDQQYQQWWTRRYGQKPEVDDRVTVGIVQSDRLVQYELRIDRSCFADGEPKSFDIRVTNGGTRLEWGGALYLPAVFRPAVFLSSN
jgi:outer membrane protein assembly factor BamB